MPEETIKNEPMPEEEKTPEERPYAINFTFVTPKTNAEASSFILRGPTVTSILLALSGLFSLALIFVIGYIAKTDLGSVTNVTMMIIAGLLIVIGLFSLFRNLRLQKAYSAGGENDAFRRVTLFYEDRLFVEAGVEEKTEFVDVSGFVRSAETKNLYLLLFKGENNTEVFYISKDGFESEEQKEEFLRRFYPKKKLAKADR